MDTAAAKVAGPPVPAPVPVPVPVPVRDPVPAITRAVAILDALSDADADGLTVTELARILKLAKSSTANICASLEATRLISRSGHRYTLGRKLVELGGRYLSSLDQVQVFADGCRRSEHVCHETARLAVLDGTDVVYLARYDGTQPLRLTANVGDRLPASVTATGKAMLATLPTAEVQRRYAGAEALPVFTDRSIPTVGQLLDELAVTRARGYAIDDEEATPGVCCVSVPVGQGWDAPAAMAVSTTVLKARLSEPLRTALVGELAVVAQQLAGPPQVAQFRAAAS
jgi:DNA-binding IclR family transcriptional regulator